MDSLTNFTEAYSTNKYLSTNESNYFSLLVPYVFRRFQFNTHSSILTGCALIRQQWRD